MDGSPDRRESEEIRIKREELALKKAEFRRTRWTILVNPVVAGLFAIFVAAFGHLALQRRAADDAANVDRRAREELKAIETRAALALEQTKREFCYRVIADFIVNRSSGGTTVLEFQQIAEALELNKACEHDPREIIDLLGRGTPPVGVTETPIPTSTPPPGRPTAIPPRCDAIRSIRDLGWTGGHKTKFCQRKGYDGVHNPFRDYSDGGFCFRGDENACATEIKRVAR